MIQSKCNQKLFSGGVISKGVYNIGLYLNNCSGVGITCAYRIFNDVAIRVYYVRMKRKCCKCIAKQKKRSIVWIGAEMLNWFLGVLR